MNNLHRVTTGDILVVEDEALVRMVSVEVFWEGGFNVYEAGTADQAIAILEQHPSIQVMFSDINMPGSMDGIELAHYVRERWPPVLLLVASGEQILEENQLPYGTKFFRKPYQADKVVATIKSMMNVDDAYG